MIPCLKLTQAEAGTPKKIILPQISEMLSCDCTAKYSYHLDFTHFHQPFWRRKWQPTPIFLPGESLGKRNLVGYSPWGHKESDITEQLSLSLTHTHTHTHTLTHTHTQHNSDLNGIDFVTKQHFWAGFTHS